jgi:ABC-2 type transport system permease protein
MREFWGISLALLKGYLRDRSAVFFSILFPLMFLVLFGGIFSGQSQTRIDLVQVGAVPLFDDLPPAARTAMDNTFSISRADSLDAAIASVRKGDADVAVEMQGDTLVAHYTQTDPAKAGIVQGTLRALVDGANVALSGAPPTFSLQTESVEDDSLKAIQFVTPGLLGWAIAMGAAIGAASTIQQWRTTGLLRRIQLSPTRASSAVGARMITSLAIALTQVVVFLAVGISFFGLSLTGSWWMAVPLVLCATLTFMALGVLAGALTSTQEGAINLANITVLPMAFLSGSFFSLDGAPAWLQTVSQVMPLRHLNDAMLNVMVRGEGPGSAVQPILLLLGVAVLLGGAAALVFRRRAA